MTKITLVVLGLCILFGQLEFAFSDTQDTEELGAEPRDEPSPNDRSGLQANSKAKVLLRPNPSPYPPAPYPVPPSPTPNPFNFIECYACTDCRHVQINTTSKVCPFTLDPTKQGRCVVYAEKYQHIKQPIYIRGCASERSSCADIRRAHTNNNVMSLVSCSECEGNKCNTSGASRSIFDFTIAFISLIVAPIVAKRAMS